MRTKKKVKFIVLGMTASLLLPLAGAFARVAGTATIDLPSGSGVYLLGEAADDGATKRRKSRDKGSKGSKERKGGRKGCERRIDRGRDCRGGGGGAKGSRGERGEKESASPS